MNSLFTGCCFNQQKVDLSNFIINPETQISRILWDFTKLKYLDISGTNANSYDFPDYALISHLEFINLYKAQNYDIKVIKKLNSDLIICQKEKSIQNKCGYYNIYTKKFDSTNLIIIYFSINVKYKYGFVSGT